MRIGGTARAFPAWLRAARDSGGDQAAEAQRTSLVMLAAARGLTLIASAALAFLSPTRSPWVLLGLAVFAVLFMTATTVALGRGAERHRPWMVHAVLTIDLVVWLAACAASGADDSYALMLYVVFPSIAAFAMTGPALAASAVTIAVMRPLLGGGLTEILAFYGVALWAFVVAIAASRGRRLVVRRLRHLDAVWSALARGPSEAVRERVADDLRRTALDPVRAIRRQIASAAPTPEASEALVAELRAIIARIREIAYELYAPPGLHGGMEAGLRHLAQRRSSDADVVVTIDPEVPESVATPLEATVRDALGLIAGAETTAITIAVRTDPGGAAATIRAVPGNGLEPHRRELRRAALMSRPGVDDVRIDQDPDGAAAVRARIHGVAPPDPAAGRIPGVALETRGFMSAARAGLIPVVLGIPLLVGGTDPGYYWVAAVTCVYLAVSAWYFWVPRSDAGHYVALLCDFAFLAACLLLVGDARPYVLPVALLIPVAQSMVLPWTLALPVAAGTAVLLPLTGPTPQPAMTVALLWAAAISMIVVRERADSAHRLLAATERRNQLLQGLLHAEDVERRRLAERLHDDVLQLLFGARQDLIEAHDGSPDALPRANATLGVVLERLTQTVSDLDVDEGAARVTGGLQEALTATARDHLGPDAQVHVDPRAAGVHDGLLVQFARELYANAVRHSRASRVQLSVSRRPERIVLDFTDDGIGFDFGAVNSAVSRGALGLATVRDRATWSGGTVELGASEHGGARVLIALPLSSRPAAGRPGAGAGRAGVP
jgi:two-component system NarL family sensor kinase